MIESLIIIAFGCVVVFSIISLLLAQLRASYDELLSRIAQIEIELNSANLVHFPRWDELKKANSKPTIGE